MTKEERLEKTAANFSSLTGQNQDRILAIMQALFFAKNTAIPVQADVKAAGDTREGCRAYYGD
jgi:hypothetical protein